MRLALTRSALFTTIAVGLVLLCTHASAVNIDDFSDQYPPNPDLPASGRPIIFVGTTCDGSACPPGAFVSHPVSDSAYQTGLTGVLGGAREATIWFVAGTANSGIYGAGNSMSFNHNSMASAILELSYGGGGGGGGMSADLTANGGTALRVEVLSGDMYAGPRPVPCTITVTSGAGTGSEATASQTLDLVDATAYSYPFTGFAGVDFTDVDHITYRFDASAVSSVDFSIGPLTTDVDEVATDSRTWGAIKGMYR
jgi:hypothetical protein